MKAMWPAASHKIPEGGAPDSPNPNTCNCHACCGKVDSCRHLKIQSHSAADFSCQSNSAFVDLYMLACRLCPAAQLLYTIVNLLTPASHLGSRNCRGAQPDNYVSVKAGAGHVKGSFQWG